MKIAFLASVFASAIIFAGCSSSDGDGMGSDTKPDEISVKGMSFSNTDKYFRNTDTNTDTDEVIKLKELISKTYTIKNYVVGITEEEIKDTVSLSYYVTKTLTIKFINKTDCEITESVDYESQLFDAIRYDTVIEFDKNPHGYSDPTWKESLTVTQLIIGSNSYNLFDYTYYNTAFKVDYLTERWQTKNDRTVTKKYTYNIDGNIVTFYSSDDNQSFNATINFPYIITESGDEYKAVQY